jgi:transmembrane protein EpsG
MIIYISMLIISILFLILEKKANKKWIKIICCIMAIMPFFIVSAFRYDLGTDYTRRYVFDYNRTIQGIDVSNLEFLFKSIMKFCIIFTEEPYLMFVITSAIVVGFILGTSFNKSKDKILSVCIFLLAGFFFDSLNIMRQYMAMSLIFFGYQFLLKSKKWYLAYVATVIIATLIHSSAIIMLILVLLTKKMLVSWKWILPTCIVVLILNENLMNILGFILQNTRFAVYLTGKFAQGEISYLFIAENLVIYLSMYYIYSKNKKLNNIQTQDILFLNIQALALIVMVLGSCHMLFIRTALYFSVFQVISIPYYISKIPNEEIVADLKKITKNKFKFSKLEKYMKQVATVLVVVCFIVAFTRTNILNNTNEVLPYKTIINKEIEIK